MPEVPDRSSPKRVLEHILTNPISHLLITKVLVVRHHALAQNVERVVSLSQRRIRSAQYPCGRKRSRTPHALKSKTAGDVFRQRVAISPRHDVDQVAKPGEVLLEPAQRPGHLVGFEVGFVEE